MRAMGAWIVPAVLLVGCAGWTGPSAVATGSQQFARQEWLEQSRRDAAAGRATSLMMGPVGIYTFYNNPRPFCYMYIIPGEWVPAQEAGAYRSKDGRAFAAVSFWLPRDLEGVDGTTLVERARTIVTLEYEKAMGQSVANVELTPFESARPKTWRWKSEPVSQVGRSTVFPASILVDLSPDAVLAIGIGGTPDDDSLARHIIASLRTTTDPKCYWPVYEKMLKAMHGER
jgi:hypothetical protein